MSRRFKDFYRLFLTLFWAVVAADLAFAAVNVTAGYLAAEQLSQPAALAASVLMAAAAGAAVFASVRAYRRSPAALSSGALALGAHFAGGLCRLGVEPLPLPANLVAGNIAIMAGAILFGVSVTSLTRFRGSLT